MTLTKVAKKRLSTKFIVDHLRAFYKAPSTVTFNRFCEKRKIKRSNLGKIWRSSGLNEMKNKNEDITKAMDELTKYLESRKQTHKHKMEELHKSHEYLTDDEVNLVITLAKLLASMGYGIDRTTGTDIITSVLKSRLQLNECLAISPSVLNLMMKRHSEIVTLIHGNAIDPARIRQATVEVRDAEFFKIERYIELLYKMGKIPWRTYKDIPKENLYNADEVATNTYDHRRKIIGIASKLGRAFQITPGGDGRMPFHITSMITSCASGKFKVPIEGIDGAPPPMIIHACSASPEKKDPGDLQYQEGQFFQHPRYSDGLSEPYHDSSADEINKNPYGFCVRTSPAGSMTQRTFYDYAIHFVNNLPESQGSNGQPVILFLDGHSSRWDVSSLLFLLTNNVFPFFLPSHTSIWTQPNDNGTNLRWVKCLERAVTLKGMRRNGVGVTPSYFNIIMRDGWKLFLRAEREDLLCCSCNNTTSAWQKTGLFPFNPFCEAWENILETMGPLNKKYKETRNEEVIEYEIKLRKGVSPLSEGERQTLTVTSKQENYIQAAYFHMRVVLMDWKRRLLFDKNATPNPTSAAQIIAQRLFQFVKRSEETVAFKDAIKKNRIIEKSEERKKQDKLRELLDCTPLTSSLPVTFQYFVATETVCGLGESRIEGHAVKIKQDTYMIYLKDQRTPFPVTQQRLLDVPNIEIERPKLIMSSEDKLNKNRRIIRESRRKEEIKVKARKEEAERERKKWMQSEYEKMVIQIKANSHCFEDFSALCSKLSEPFEYRSIDGYLTKCTSNESVCVTSMALRAIDGVLTQKRQAEELSRINALEKRRKSAKRKRTPNTTRGDDGIGIIMGLQDYDIMVEEEAKAKDNKKLQKEISQLENRLQDFAALKAKYNASIDIRACLASELTTILNVCGLGKGNSGKTKEAKKQILLEKNITCERILTFVDEETRRLTGLKEQLSGSAVVCNSEEDAMSVASEQADSDDESCD